MSNKTAEYVIQSPDGGWRVSGTRVTIDSIVHGYWSGRSPEAIAADFPSLTLEQIHGAIAFYLRRRDELDQYLTEQDSHWQQFQQESANLHAPLLQQIRVADQQRATSRSKP
jgi:uncharacterized protein (DUF433 family)